MEHGTCAASLAGRASGCALSEMDDRRGADTTASCWMVGRTEARVVSFRACTVDVAFCISHVSHVACRISTCQGMSREASGCCITDGT
jgi:hypothetical protein